MHCSPGLVVSNVSSSIALEHACPSHCGPEHREDEPLCIVRLPFRMRMCSMPGEEHFSEAHILLCLE